MRNCLAISGGQARAAGALAVLITLALAASAQAGEWTQVTCAQPDGQPAPIEGWEASSYGGYGAGSGPINTCPQGGGLTAFDSSEVEEAAYTGPMWVYTAPAGSTIAGGTLVVWLSTPQGQAFVATPENEYNQANVVINCQFNEPCGTTASTVPIDHPGGTQLFELALCVGPTYGATTCPAGSGGGTNAEISVDSADIELTNDATPTGTGFSGTLLEGNASGTADLTFSAQDPNGPGVYEVTATIDGKQVYQGNPEPNEGKCASIGSDPNGVQEFLYAQPCKQTVAVDASINTIGLSNGQHHLVVSVTDAAGNSAAVLDRTITVANGSGASNVGGSSSDGPIGPGSPAALRGAPNGTNASDQAKLTARWAKTAKVALTGRYGKRERVTGTLTTTAGQPITGASLNIYATPAYQGAHAQSLGSVQTSATGAWTLTLPATISSSTLSFAYRSHVNDTIPVATTGLKLSVHAGLSLRIVPHTTSVGRKIYFSGTLHGTPIPSGGKQLELEASSGGEWIQFDTITTNSKGRYHASYRFKFPGPITYKFRVISPYEADFPYLSGISNNVAVHER